MNGKVRKFFCEHYTLPENDRSIIIKEKLYKKYLINPYIIANSFLKDGLFHVSGDSDDNFPYRTRLYWDYFKFDPLAFFKNYGDDNRASAFAVVKNNEDIFQIFKKSAGGDISSSLLNLTDGINNFKSDASGPLTSILKDVTIFTEWNSSLAKAQNKIKPDGTEISYTLPPLSGISKNFLVKDLIANYSPGIAADSITLQFTDNPDVKFAARTSVERSDGTTMDAKRTFVFQNTDASGVSSIEGKIQTGTAYKPTSDYDLNEKIIFNIVNSGNTERTVKIKISSKCLFNCLPKAIIQYTKKYLDVSFSSTDSSVNSSSSGIVYSWDFGDGSPVEVASGVTHKYPQEKKYTVKLTLSSLNQPAFTSVASVELEALDYRWARASWNGGNSTYDHIASACSSLIVRGMGGWHLASKPEAESAIANGALQSGIYLPSWTSTAGTTPGSHIGLWSSFGDYLDDSNLFGFCVR